MGHWLYSSVAFTKRVASYQGAMGTYQCFLWDTLSPVIETLPEDKRILAQTFQQERLSVVKQQVLAVCHAVNATFISSSVSLHCFSWLRMAGLAEDTCTRVRDLLFDGMGLFNAETDYILENVQEKRMAARCWGVYPTFQQCPEHSGVILTLPTKGSSKNHRSKQP